MTRPAPRAPRPAFELFAVTAPGLEALAAGELAGLGIAAAAVPGGATFSGGWRAVELANLWLRTAARVVARVGRFHARAFGELERHARAQPWERFLVPGRDVRLRVSCKKSRLYHSDAVAERVAGAVGARLGRLGAVEVGGDEEDETEGGRPAALVIVRVFHDECTLSVDSSGALLHRRGYRLATAKAPMRETLAAATLLASGWRPESPLLDPMCGSGTIAIEAAMMARRVAPGLSREFAFAHWPGFDAAPWERLRAEARSQILPNAPAPILASDRDAGAIAAAAANAERAGVAADVTLRVAPLSSGIAGAAGQPTGWLVTNPPYGVRVGERGLLRDLFAQLGNAARRALPGWTLTLVSADAELERRVGVSFETMLRTTNGGIPVRVVRGRVEGK